MKIKMVEFDRIRPGTTIWYASESAVNLSNSQDCQVRFVFNDTEVIVSPNETVEEVVNRWDADMKKARQEYLNSTEYAERCRKEEEDRKQKNVCFNERDSKDRSRNERC